MSIHAVMRMLRWYVAPPGSETPPEIARPFRRNYLANLTNLISWHLGNSFLSSNTILPVFISHLTSSPIVIGLIPALNDALYLVPQLALAPYTERLSRKLPLLAWLGFLERLPYTILPVMALWLAVSNPSTQAAIGIFFLILMWKSLAGGMTATPWQELTAKLIPATHRGRFFSVASFLGQLLGIAAALVAAQLLASLPYPYNFALCFFIGAIFNWVGYLALMQSAEPVQLPPPKPAVDKPGYGYIQRLTYILQSDGNFRAYLVSRWLLALGGMANGFLAIYALHQFHLPDSSAAIWGSVQTAAAVAGYTWWGPLCDRLGYKRVMVMAASLWGFGLMVAWLSSSVWGFYLVFGLLGISLAGTLVADFGLVMELGPESERPTYMGLARTVTGPMMLIAPILGGWIAATWNYSALFATAFVFSIAGTLVFGLRVQDPRRLAQMRQISGQVNPKDL